MCRCSNLEEHADMQKLWRGTFDVLPPTAAKQVHAELSGLDGWDGFGRVDAKQPGNRGESYSRL